MSWFWLGGCCGFSTASAKHQSVCEDGVGSRNLPPPPKRTKPAGKASPWMDGNILCLWARGHPKNDEKKDWELLRRGTGMLTCTSCPPQQQRREKELRKQQEREQRRHYEEQMRREEERRRAEHEQVTGWDSSAPNQGFSCKHSFSTT